MADLLEAAVRAVHMEAACTAAASEDRVAEVPHRVAVRAECSVEVLSTAIT
jgi:hypothetical protein